MRKTMAMLASTVAAAGIITGGLASASASTARPAASVNENFYLMTTSATATTMPVIAAGLFTAAGVDHVGNTIDKAVFPTGTFKINHSGALKGTPKLNPTTCFFSFTGKGPFTIMGGTGAYAGISGKGNVVITIVGILGRSKSGACSQNAKPVAWQQAYRATASVKL